MARGGCGIPADTELSFQPFNVLPTIATMLMNASSRSQPFGFLIKLSENLQALLG
jgi:hypothetical protein